MPEVFIFVLLIILGAPIAKAIGARIAGVKPQVPPDVLQRLRQEIAEAAQQHSLDAEHRVAELEDRVDFLEKLLQGSKPSPPLPPAGGPTSSV